jgi:prevent-host-death family protein
MTMKKGRRTIPAGQFKSHCLAILDQVSGNRESVIVTKRGRPVAQLVPLEEHRHKSLLGSVRQRGNIVEGLGEVWESEK